MNIIIISFMIVDGETLGSSFCNIIPSDSFMYNALLKELKNISDDYVLMSVAINAQQEKIDRSAKHSGKKRIFLSQHASTYKLKFEPTDIIITGSSHLSNPQHLAIPFYPLNYWEGEEQVRDKLFSFTGMLATHPIRSKLSLKYPNEITSTGVICWSANLPRTQEPYKQELATTKFAICPRGYGISSIRLWEALASGCVPVIIADGYKKPLGDLLDWDEFSVTIPENDLNLDFLKDLDFNKMQNRAKEVYQEYFSKENFAKSVVLSINK